MSVDINASRDHHLPIGLDGLHASRDDQVVSNLPGKTVTQLVILKSDFEDKSRSIRILNFVT